MPDNYPPPPRPSEAQTLALGSGELSPSESSVSGLPTGTVFGDYELLAEIGRGGMGVVFKARQKSLNRIIALKMLLPGSVPTGDELQRFRNEAEAAGRLKHKHIVSVHTVGEIDGRHFFSMDYIAGPSLVQRLGEGPLPERVAARYILIVAHAIQHAHEQGILHRDLKPGNILLDDNDDPHVTDFGLAKRLDTDTAHNTRTGSILGTPSYMAPEQAGGKTKDIGPAVDVYGLGAVLYEMLTGRPPFRSDTPIDTLMHVLEREPAPPRLLNPKVSRDLEAICLKCLEKNPRRRYSSAEELASDLQRFLNGETITASSFNVLDRLARTLERGHYDFEFRRYGTMLLYFGLIIGVTHLVIFLLAFRGPPYPLGWIGITRGLQFLFLGVAFWCYRGQQVLPTSMAERQLWAVVVSYLTASFLAVVVMHQLAGSEPLDDIKLFPVWAILSGMTLCTLGSSYWGRCYVFGVLFFLAALLIPFQLRFGPLIVGAIWTAFLTTIGLHLRRLGDQAP